MALTVAQLVARLTADTSGFYRGMALANSSMIRTGGLITRVATGAGLAVAGMGILSLRSAGNFQESMNILQAVSGATKEQFKGLHDEAIALGRDMKLPNVSAKDAAEAMQELAKAGLNVNDIMGATRGTLQFGIAANIGFADSAAIVARALTAFNLKGTEATKVADLFTAAANKSTASAQDIALGFQMASAQFAAGDQTIEGLTTSLTLMANAGIVGSDAGTSLKTMMNRLMAPTKKAKDEMEDLGFKVYDASGNMKSMPDLIGDLEKSLVGMTKEQRNATLYTIFGSDAIRAARVQLAAGEKGWRKMEERITKGGEAQAFAEARTKGFNGAVQALFSQVETLAIELGEHMLPSAEAVTRAMARFVASIDPDKIAAFFGAIKDGIGAFITFVRQSDLAQYALTALAGALVGMYVMTKIIALVNAMKIAMIGLNLAMLTNPFVLAAAAIIGLGAALVLAYKKSEQFREIVHSVFGWLESNVLPIVQQIADGIRTHWGTIVTVVRTYLNLIRTYWEQTFGRILNFYIQHWDQIRAVASAVLGNLLIMIRGALKTIEGVINLVMGIIKGDWGRAWQGIKQIVDGTLGSIAALIKNILTRLVPAVLGLALAIGKAILTGIGNGIANLASWLGGKIKGGVSAAISAVIGFASGLASSIGRAIMDGILGGIGGLAGALKDKLTGAIGGALGSVKGAFGIGSPSRVFADQVGKPIADGIILGFLMGSHDLPTKISDSVRSALEKGKQVVDEYKQRFTDAFSQMASDALEAFDRITSAHRTRSEKLLDTLVSQHDAAEFKRRLQEARADLQTAQNEMASFDPSGFDSPEAAAEELKRREQAVLDAQRTWDELKYEQKRLALERQAEKERSNYEDRRAIQRRHFEQELAQLQKALLEHPREHQKNQIKIRKMLLSWGISYHEIGTRLGKHFAEGIRASIFDVQQAAMELAGAVGQILKIKSPTEKGPMSDLDHWWDGLATTLVSGIDKSPIESAALSLAGAMRPLAGGGFAYAGSGTSMTGTMAGTTIVNVYPQGSVIAAQDLSDTIREVLFTEQRRGRAIP